MDEKADRERGPNPIDQYVGQRIRARRKVLGVSQEKLADQLGLTFQQVQKYERGANRVSASKLYEIARALKSSIPYFFHDLPDPAADAQPGMAEGGAPAFVHDAPQTPEAVEMGQVYSKLRRPKVKKHLLGLARALADEEAADA